MISIINYQMGNLQSLKNALDFLGIEHQVVENPSDLKKSEKLILPGVGSFKKAMENLKNQKLIDILNEKVLQDKIPVLGICLGMQLFASVGEENGITEGLGWIKGEVKRFSYDSKLELKVPHIGYNTAIFTKNNIPLYRGLNENADFYFVHSYRLVLNDENNVTSWTKYGEKFVSSVQNKNIYGTQFHPEKSQSNGLRVLENFSVL